MAKTGPKSRRQTQTLRQRAEQQLRQRGPDVSKMPEPEVRALAHELQTHQMELELQNRELREAQRSLAESRDRYSDLYDFAPVAYVTLDESGRILEANLTASLMLGVDRSRLVGTTLSSFAGHETSDDLDRHLRNVFSSDTRQVSELDMKQNDGTPLCCRLESIVAKAGTGRCQTVMIDITDVRTARRDLQYLNEELEQRVRKRTVALRRRTDQLAWQAGELDRQQHYFKTLADNVPALFSYVDSEQRHQYVNSAYSKLFARPASEIVGRTVLELLGGEAFAIAQPHVEAALAGEEVTYDAEFDFADGPHAMHVQYVPDRGQQGVVHGFFALVTDITPLKQAENRLRESEERMRAILNTAADAIVTITDRGTIVDLNPATERMFGYTREEIVNQNISILMPEPYRSEHDGYISRYRETGETRIIGTGREVEGRRKDGTIFPIDLAVSEVEQLRLFTGIIRDIGGRKQIEQTLQKSRDDLRTMSAELMLTEERERRQLAQDLHDGLGQSLFLINRKLSELPAEDQNVSEIRSILDVATKTVNALTFELSPPVLQDLGLRPAVKWLARDIQKRYGLSVEIEGEDSPFEVEERVATVLFRSVRELLINVAKHAQTDAASVCFRRTDHIGEIVVRDRGRGFDIAAQSGQVQAGHFGLFSIRERLSYLGGQMTIRSAPGEGSTMTLTVPLG